MDFLLKISSEQYGDKIIETEGFLETLGFGGQMLLLGIGTVFSVLLIIWFSLTMFKFVFAKSSTPKKSAKVINEAIEEPAVTTTDASDDEIVAVISAAIAMAESESDGVKFRVVSFRRR